MWLALLICTCGQNSNGLASTATGSHPSTCELPRHHACLALHHECQAIGSARNAPRPPRLLRQPLRGQLGSPCCLTGVDNHTLFPPHLCRITTIFPLLLLCVLGATFYISSSLPRPVADQTHRGPDASKCNTLGESISGRPGTDASGMGESVQASATSLAVPTRTFDRTKSGRSFHVRKPGPEGHSDLAQVGLVGLTGPVMLSV